MNTQDALVKQISNNKISVTACIQTESKEIYTKCLPIIAQKKQHVLHRIHLFNVHLYDG